MFKIEFRKGNKGCLVALLVIAVIFGIFAAWFNISGHISDKKTAAYIEDMSVVLEESYRCDASADKAIVHASNEINDITIYTRGGFTTRYLPEGTGAEESAQVRYLVYVSTKLEKVGEYIGGSDASRADYVISVVDLQTGKVIGRTTIEGYSPPYSTSKSGGDHGNLPIDSTVTEWLQVII